ncbi:hypothetical protein [Pseudoxanthomonas dokdonensis]|uniref:Uncharacterized protein n=1 Tax=Pseudoxanthomonas dokdonensis TaxID=344882 RepID=A0A0R0CSI9_9GAMM|nr:hypothetical protein [Pseudoxanthomonas dokdonensis]KRG69047.1 hypothetical protein ABB29_11470 [Pseudoxanthomonas dokdonensis]
MASNASRHHSTQTTAVAPPPSLDANPAPVSSINADRRQWLQMMAADEQWQCNEQVGQCVQALLRGASAGGSQRGIQAETLAAVAHELDCYRDFRRLRALEAGLRHCSEQDFPFDRQHWQRARQAEQALREYHRHVRDESFVLAPPDQFRIH